MSTEDNIPEDEIGDDELSALYRKAEDATPPATLDQTILAAAKQAVETRTATHGSTRAPFSGRWTVAASAAAVVVIVILLAPLLERHTPPVVTTSPSEMDHLSTSSEEAEAENAVRERLTASSPGHLYAPSPAQMPAVQQQSAMEELVKDEDSVNAADRSSAATPVSALKTESQGRLAQARLNAASGAPLAIFTPEMWLVKIQQLIDSGKIREAGDELDKFRRAHPDYELDKSLLEQLKQP